MCGCGNQRFNLEPCTILLVIAILNNLCLLDTQNNPVAKNALTLLFLYWLCGCNGTGISPNNNRKGNNGICCC
ncbi:hypothetical protein J2Z44_002004 [Clostridium punense]|uniref:Uncharacterized protein n=1 Tax=Clostridium punense TaxID=1054297 RepID=A0ABS4K356_9CLOT|nr:MULTISPECIES: hypothetical protein [Clostridium]EQB88730.1 hypothetical protein M918_23450 [Clostridium sp. BL8]MBP2022203.1 hypothetical protein [Clostridium punense]